MVMPEFITSRLTDETTQTSAAIQRDASINPLATLFDGVGRSDLGNYVQTESVRYEESSSVPRYPIETGQDASDNTVSNPPVISIRGVVTSQAGGGSGAAEVADTLRNLLKDGEVVSIDTARGIYDNCVISRFTERQSERTGVGLAFEVQLTQVILGGLPIYLPEDPEEVTARDYVSEDAYLQLFDEESVELTAEILDARNVDIDRGFLYTKRPGLPIHAESLDSSAIGVVTEQVRELHRLGIEEPPYPDSFIRAQMTDSFAKALGVRATELGVPIAGVDMQLIRLDSSLTAQYRDFVVTVDNIPHDISIGVRRITGSDGQINWVIDITTRVSGLPEAVSELRSSVQNGYLLKNGGTIKIYSPTPSRLIGAFIVYGLGDVSIGLGPRPWGRTHQLVFTTNLQYIANPS